VVEKDVRSSPRCVGSVTVGDVTGTVRGTALSSDGVSIRYEVHGAEGRPLVFVHGWSCDRSYWRGQVEHFARGHRVVTVDLAGHGESGAGRDEWTMPAFGEDVVAVVEELGLEDMVLAGHSMGGDVIVEAALRLRGRVAALVWVDVYAQLGGPSRDVDAFMQPFRRDFVTATRDFVRQLFTPDSDRDLVEWVAADMSSAPPEIALDAMKHAITNDEAILSRLRELDVPFFAINPDSRPTDVESLRRHGVEPVVMPGVAHFLMLENPQGFNRLLDDVFDSCGTP
jgi:pimeloyl-ACP methyl ester carboxylesterase